MARLCYPSLLLLLASATTKLAQAAQPSALAPAVIVNEVASNAAGGVCDGEDWVEIANVGSTTVPDLSVILLADDNGPGDKDARALPAQPLAPGAFLLLCRDVDFDFGISDDDTVSLFFNGTLLSTTGVMPDHADDDITYARRPDRWGPFAYSRNPTPGSNEARSRKRRHGETRHCVRGEGFSRLKQTDKQCLPAEEQSGRWDVS